MGVHHTGIITNYIYMRNRSKDRKEQCDHPHVTPSSPCEITPGGAPWKIRIYPRWTSRRGSSNNQRMRRLPHRYTAQFHGIALGREFRRSRVRVGQFGGQVWRTVERGEGVVVEIDLRTATYGQAVISTIGFFVEFEEGFERCNSGC